MNRAATFLLAASLVTSASVARAQPDKAPAAPEADAAPRAAASCELGETGGLAAERTRIWQMLLCDELARRGKTAVMGPGAREVFRLDVMPLDKKIIVRLTHESPAGTWAASERAVLSDADELLTALPRLVTAVSKGTSFEQTASVTNLTGGEVRPSLKRHGEMYAGGSLLGVVFPGMHDASVTPALGLTMTYETPALAAVADLRFTVGGDRPDHGNRGDKNTYASWVSLSMGGRYFLADTDMTPFVGSGLGLHWLAFDAPSGAPGGAYDRTSDIYKNSKNNGLGVYLEAGVEIFRTHRSRMTFGVRLDLPMYRVQGESSRAASLDDNGKYVTTEREAPEPRYVVPLSLAGAYYFH